MTRATFVSSVSTSNDKASTTALEVEFTAGEISQMMNRAYHQFGRSEILDMAETVRAAIALHNRQGPLLNELARLINADLVP